MATSSSLSSDGAPPRERLFDDHPIEKIPYILPHERVFPIQIGTELFKLSGASLSSDAPSYFSQFFLCQLKTAEQNGEDMKTAPIKTLYIDRDPVTFKDISLHLQGYHIEPRDGKHFVRLFADAKFYTLPKLTSQLLEESIFISIGHREFQIPRTIFSGPGNTPNYFTLGFTFFFNPEQELFPGLDRSTLIRPPSIMPPSVPGRCADIFEQLLKLLRGYPVDIRSEAHREDLLKDARYFHFRGLEQRLIPCERQFNQARGGEEITLRVENVQKSGISVQDGTVYYARPFLDEKPAALVLEIGNEQTRLHFDDEAGTIRAEFFNDTKARMKKLYEIVALQLHGTSTTPDELWRDGAVQVYFEKEGSAIALDAEEYEYDNTKHFKSQKLNGEEDSTVDNNNKVEEQEEGGGEDQENPRKRKRKDDSQQSKAKTKGPWTVLTGQWRLQMRCVRKEKDESSVDFVGVKCVLVAVKVDAVSSAMGRNKRRGFLGS